jgi:hypothetical protein
VSNLRAAWRFRGIFCIGGEAHCRSLHCAPAPGFPVKARGFDHLHAALFKESRKRGRRQQREVGNPGPGLRSG